MEVELYVYDLSMGMARQYSRAMTGVQIDAIYHTAIVFNNVEYFFGQGIHRKIPGSTHHGRPISILKLGNSHLPLEVIEEYIESLESIYTPESYDLFVHNCNNFTQDLAMFLVGKSIPENIRTLPETFLRTPIGQMLRGQIDQSMRTMTQAPDAVAGQNTTVKAVHNEKTTSNGTSDHSPAIFVNGKPRASQPGHVYNVTSNTELEKLLKSAQNTCAVIFFTSSTCAPCKIVYPAYDELASEAGQKSVLIKVGINQAYDVAMKYQVRATPTFMTYLKGQKENEWQGANEAQLRGNINLLIQMANPQHRHSRLRLPHLQKKIEVPIMYSRTPPLEKLLTKLGPASQDAQIQDLVQYLKARDKKGLAQAPLPDMSKISQYIVESLNQLSSDVHFAFIDLVRTAAADPRVSSFLVTENGLRTLSTLMPSNKEYSSMPYNLQAVTLQLACNLFGSNVFQEQLMSQSCQFRTTIEKLASDCLLASNNKARSFAGALTYNLAAIDHNERMEGRPDLVDLGGADELEAALVEAIVNESESKETIHALLLALGMLLYGTSPESSIWDLCNAMDVKAALAAKAKLKLFSDEPLINEVGKELLAKGGS